ncbi:MAG: primosomal protein DnaI [Bacillaceae bacterium]|nr:primosomal protein DnaI [Bacillaceae bacterium]
MEPIQTTLKKWMRESESFQQTYQKMKKNLLESQEIKDFLAQNPEITKIEIEKQLMKLYEYHSQSKKCENCPSLKECGNLVKGYVPYIHASEGQIRITYDRCPRKKKADEQNRKRAMVQSLYMPKDVLQANFEEIRLDDPERYDAIRKLKQYLEQERITKGLYLYGPFGVGKTYLLGALANELAERNIQSLFIYMPEFVREIKSSINDSTLNEKIDQFKRVPILILDDIGAEYQSAWFRDEVLGAILQYRMMEHLPVFFTSNYSLEELEKILSFNHKGDTELVKAGRIIERIRQVSEPVAMFGQNQRG